MKYRVSFVPKKSGQAIRPEAFTSLIGLFEAIKIHYQTHKLEPSRGVTVERFLGNVKHLASSVVDFSNLRVICAPNQETKEHQWAALRLLERIPVHKNAHGFVRGRDSRSCAEAHTLYWGSKADHLVVLNMDAKDFFHSVTSPHLRRALEAHGLAPKNVAQVIDLCTIRANEELAGAVIQGLSNLLKQRGRLNSIVEANVQLSLEALEKSVFGKKLAFVLCQNFLGTGPGVTMATRFLPQGAPTSPVLSNLTLKLVDIRLSAIARSFGGYYTRYADDLTVSWIAPTKGKVIDGMYRCCGEVLKEYDILLNRRKKRVMGRGTRQDIVGYCVNSGRPTISQKARRKRIRAMLHNELVRGSKRLRSGERLLVQGENYDQAVPSIQRQSVLLGHLGYVGSVHPEEAARQLRVFHHVCDRTDRTLQEINDTNLDTTIEIVAPPISVRDIGRPV